MISIERTISLGTAILLGLSAYLLLFRFTHTFERVIFGFKRPLTNTLKDGLVAGAAGTLGMLAIIAFMAFLDENFAWTFQSLTSSIIIAAICGAFIMLGSMWQLFLTSKIRDRLIKQLSQRNPQALLDRDSGDNNNSSK